MSDPKYIYRNTKTKGYLLSTQLGLHLRDENLEPVKTQEIVEEMITLQATNRKLKELNDNLLHTNSDLEFRLRQTLVH